MRFYPLGSVGKHFYSCTSKQNIEMVPMPIHFSLLRKIQKNANKAIFAYKCNKATSMPNQCKSNLSDDWLVLTSDRGAYLIISTDR